MAEPGAAFMAVYRTSTAEVLLRGELDPLTFPRLAERLGQVLDQAPGKLVFDLRAVTFIDCATARLPAHTCRRLPSGTRPVIRHPSDPVRRLLRLTGLGTAFDIAG